MSETARTRQRGIQLLRQCWKPVFVILLLTNVMSVIAQIIMQPVPVAANEAVSLVGLTNGGDIPTGCLVAGIAMQLIEALVLRPVLLQGLYKSLLCRLRGEECSLHVIASSLKRWKTAIALDFQVSLRMLGYQLLGVIGIFLLSFIPILGPLGAAIGYVVLMYWVVLRYFDARIHLADDADRQLNSTDCIAYSLHDAEMYSIPGLFKTLWPTFIPAIFGSMLTEFLPASLTLACIEILLSMLSAAMQAVICTEIYARLQPDKQLAQDNANESPGLARARALAASSAEN